MAAAGSARHCDIARLDALLGEGSPLEGAAPALLTGAWGGAARALSELGLPEAAADPQGALAAHGGLLELRLGPPPAAPPCPSPLPPLLARVRDARRDPAAGGGAALLAPAAPALAAVSAAAPWLLPLAVAQTAHGLTDGRPAHGAEAALAAAASSAAALLPTAPPPSAPDPGAACRSRAHCLLRLWAGDVCGAVRVAAAAGDCGALLRVARALGEHPNSSGGGLLTAACHAAAAHALAQGSRPGGPATPPCPPPGSEAAAAWAAMCSAGRGGDADMAGALRDAAWALLCGPCRMPPALLLRLVRGACGEEPATPRRLCAPDGGGGEAASTPTSAPSSGSSSGGGADPPEGHHHADARAWGPILASPAPRSVGDRPIGDLLPALLRGAGGSDPLSQP
eukprot:TRINITY_DN3235_c0_g3_i1.p1 TRINITY_DN3235_c0_g3~~TRINITY_DN3235_c0_g3_i1.p1  ORF type:complete len:432 (+),score=113.99 TRINITY_DN3235_c0_g3_i1:107-1297(+)